MTAKELIKAIKGECGVPLEIAKAITEKRQQSYDAGRQTNDTEWKEKIQERIKELEKEIEDKGEDCYSHFDEDNSYYEYSVKHRCKLLIEELVRLLEEKK